MSTDRTTVSTARGEVPEAFDEVADRYDLMVGLNPGYHAHLRDSAKVLVAGLIPGLGSRVVDLGCGSGASTKALVDELNRAGVRAEVLGVDGSRGMLEQAEGKAWPSWVRFAPGRAESLGSVCADTHFQPLDGVFTAYLLRNVPDRDALLRSVHDLLRPGGTLVVHEYSVAGRPVSEKVWTAVCRGIVVPLGWLTSRRTRLYHYLWRSVMDMDSVEQVMQRMVDAGFQDVRSRSVRGWQHGIIHTFHGRRAL
jgi:ubiquinone/menaquinone biosynthesis C-methylase UbiE